MPFCWARKYDAYAGSTFSPGSTDALAAPAILTDPPDDEFKETLVGWFAAEAVAQQQPEEARILWLNRLRNRDLDRLERARRAVPAGDNAVKIENDLEFPL